jgi:hypothetical protein
MLRAVFDSIHLKYIPLLSWFLFRFKASNTSKYCRFKNMQEIETE